MTKDEFIYKLNSKLCKFPDAEVNDRISFYIEMIDDYMEEGLSESEAIEKLGSIDEIAESIAGDIPLAKIAKKNLKSKRKLSVLEIILLIVGFPIWFSLLVAVIAIAIALYASIWAVIISLWAIDLALIICLFSTPFLLDFYPFQGNILKACVCFGAVLVLVGLSLLFYLLSKHLTIFVIKLTKKSIIGVKNLFIKKEE